MHNIQQYLINTLLYTVAYISTFKILIYHGLITAPDWLLVPIPLKVFDTIYSPFVESLVFVLLSNLLKYVYANHRQVCAWFLEITLMQLYMNACMCVCQSQRL